MRAELVMGGVAIFEGIYDVFPINPVHVADRGLREGILFDLMQ
jgi:exopolyphosphatase/guanosine-5'-triphosphate,3'-diphosphate pyrophosphatase